MSNKFCANCQRPVSTDKDLSVLWFIIGFILTSGLWIFIWPIYAILKRGRCPICRTPIA